MNRTKCHGHDLPRIARNLPILALGIPWASFWEGLGHSWARLGCSCRLLDVSWEPLGRPLGDLGRLLPLGDSWAHLERFGIDFEGFQGRFGRGLDGVRTSNTEQ